MCRLMYLDWKLKLQTNFKIAGAMMATDDNTMLLDLIGKETITKKEAIVNSELKYT